jgi:hypothetical protein
VLETASIELSSTLPNEAYPALLTTGFRLILKSLFFYTSHCSALALFIVAESHTSNTGQYMLHCSVQTKKQKAEMLD